ncbi:MAG: hypothetical protein JXR37_26280 [Kiritimatiellae bacterium]|nr:hypothetical protein [Kiritimatiellia bacterium]
MSPATVELTHAGTEAAVVVHPAPSGAEMSDDYTVKVNGKEVPVYRAAGTDAPERNPYDTKNFRIHTPYSFAYFDFAGPATVEITTADRSLDAVAVRPESKSIEAAVEGKSMVFTLSEAPCHLSIEPAARDRPLLLFGNPLEQDAPNPNDPDVVYFGPGFHKPDSIILTSDQTLYIAGGAVVQAGVTASGSNIRIRGRGILDGLPWDHAKGPQPDGGAQPMLYAKKCSDLSIEGIIVKDSWRWNVGIYSSSHVEIRNLKVVANRCENEDGIDLLDTQHVTISDCFIRSDDDCIALLTQWTTVPVFDVTATRCSLWSDRGQIWRIGSGWQRLGVACPPMKQLRFKDIDVLHCGPAAVARLEPNKHQPLEDVRIENLRVHREGQKLLWKVQPWPETYSPIRNCVFKDIFVTGESGGRDGIIRVQAPDAQATVSDITFENFVRYGRLTLRDSPDVEIGENTHNITFTGPAASE